MAEWLAIRHKANYVSTAMKFIGLADKNGLVAVCGYDGFNEVTIKQHIAVDGQINREFLWFIFYYPFVQLGVNKIIGPVHSENEKCLRFAKKLGFSEEARIKDGLKGGDLVLLTLTKEKCKFLTIGRP